MALLHGGASLVPSKLELLAAWLPSRPWFTGDASALEAVGSYRFDDPDGEVGMETHLVRAGEGWELSFDFVLVRARSGASR